MTLWLHLLRKRSEKFTTDQERIDQWMESAKNSVEYEIFFINPGFNFHRFIKILFSNFF